MAAYLVHIAAFDHGGEVHAAGSLLDGVRVGIRVGAQFVVEVCHDDAVPALAQDAQQAQAVGSAGDARDDGSVLCEAALVAQDGGDVLEH
jgi:hypothetical protein